MRHALSLSASVLALVCCSAAYAQTASDDSKNTVETVTVTAERRPENLMKTPISADVLSAADLANKGVARVDDLQFSMPNVAVDNFGQGIDFNIRGIGKGEHNSQTLPGVITYRDGVATFPGYITEEPYYDESSVQVLRGPQGTFVGQNATGGAVFVTSTDPVIGGGYGGYVMASAGNYSEYAAQGAVNIPINDTLAIRVALFGDSRDSFFHITDSDPADACPHDQYAGCKHDYNPGNQRWAAGRFSLLWTPTSQLTVSFKYDADYLNNGALPSSPYQDGLKSLPAGVYPGLGYLGESPNPHYSDIFRLTANYPMMSLDRFTRAILKVDYKFEDGITLQSVSGFQYGSTDYTTDLDGTDYGAANYAGAPSTWGFRDRVDETIYSEELNLISPDTGRFTWIAGLFGQTDTYNYPYYTVGGTIIPQFQTIIPGTANSTLYGKNPEVSVAGFGQVSYKVTDDLELQLGGRYSYGRTSNYVVWNQYGTYSTQTGATSHAVSYSLDYKGSINYQLNDNNFLYAFVGTGYKPGGLNPPIYTVAQPGPFRPEHVTEYETGWKATLFDGHLRSTLDGYYNDYKNFIVTVAYPAYTAPISGFAEEVNDPHTTKVYGFEAESDAVFGNFTFGFGLGLNHSSLGTFYATDARIGNPFGSSCNPASGPSFPPYCINLHGHSLPYAPNLTYNLSASYQFQLSGNDTLTPRANFGHQSGQWDSIFENTELGDHLSQRNLLGAQLEWAHNDWLVTLYGTNLTDQHYAGAILWPLRFAGPPRQYGIRIMKTF
jgi:iron complex outermembrane receptor protein